MLYGRRSNFSSNKSGHEPHHALFSKVFHYKYSWYLLTTIVGAGLILLTPTFYFINENYTLLKDLAYNISPALISHLEREINWLFGYFMMSLFILAGASLYISTRLTRQLMAPLSKMETHMRQFTAGKWSITDFNSNADDDLKEFAMTYDYFQHALKNNAETEYKLLKSLYVDPKNSEAFSNWKMLMKIYETKLDIQADPTSIANAEESIVFASQRRAS